METQVAIQVIKVYYYTVKHKKDEDPYNKIYDIPSTEIEENGKLMDVEIDYAEEI